MTQDQKDNLVIKNLRIENTNLKIKLARMQRELPTPDEIRKGYFVAKAIEWMEVIHNKNKKVKKACKAS